MVYIHYKNNTVPEKIKYNPAYLSATFLLIHRNFHYNTYVTVSFQKCNKNERMCCKNAQISEF